VLCISKNNWKKGLWMFSPWRNYRQLKRQIWLIWFTYCTRISRHSVVCHQYMQFHGLLHIK
jgi:hypothetical protein